MTIDDRIESALHFLGETDEEAAVLKHNAALAEHKYKKSCDAHFLALDGPVEVRKAKARMEAEQSYLDFLEAQMKYDTVKNKRDRACITIEVARSQMADRRRGNV